jgi:hypothetical protein
MTLGAYSAYMPSLETAQRIRYAVIAEMLKTWPASVTTVIR